MLPQKHPLHYYAYENRSYNVAEFVTGPVKPYKVKSEKLINVTQSVNTSVKNKVVCNAFL